MSHPGGGADAHARSRFDPDWVPVERRRSKMRTLWKESVLTSSDEGDYHARSRFDPDWEPVERRRSKKRRPWKESVLTSSDEGDYQPKTKETRAACEAMLSVIQQQLGGQPLNIVSGAADEILAVLKNDNFKNPEKKKEIEKLLNPILSNTFDQLVSIRRLISDYHDGGDAGDAAVDGDDGLDDDVGGGVEFEEIEEEMMDLGQDHVAILEQLHATRATAKERQKNLEISVREEARRLKDDAGGDGDRERRQPVDRDADGDWLKVQRELLDLENLFFHQGGLLMAKEKWVLPMCSYRINKKGYEEVHVPSLEPSRVAANEKLVKISDMPDWAQPAFKGMTQLNRVQSKVYDTALFSAGNMLLCAPTGAGKTDVAILTILQQIALNINEDKSINHSNYKIVYVAPMKALVAEVVFNLSNRLEQYGVRVKELSGDQTLTRQQIEETQIIVTTPEKWDIITRKSGDRTYTQLVKLLIIDEIHLLHDTRGPVLESIIARTVRQIETTKERIRLVGLSATLPNYEEIAILLRVKLDKGLFHFDNSYRPVPLIQQYIGITVKKPLQRQFQLMNDVCYEKAISVAGKHQVLIFVHSRKETTKTGRAIRDTALTNDTLGKFLEEDSASREILRSHTELVKSSDLKDLLPYGFAIHHAGMVRADRQIVEKLFADGHVQVLVSTATLAWCVDLRARIVIIKGTQIYNPEKGAWTELSPVNVVQMLGRAGRPRYDNYGEGIIITGHSELQYYLSLTNRQLPTESQFISKLADRLNAEIVLGTVQNAEEAWKWLLYTYLWCSHGAESYKEHLKPTMGDIDIAQLKLEGVSLTSDMVEV